MDNKIKREFLVDTVYMSGESLDWYKEQMKDKKPLVHKEFEIKNDVGDEILELIRKYGLKTDKLSVIDNYVHYMSKTMRIAKYIKGKLNNEQLKTFNQECSKLINSGSVIGTLVISNNLEDMLLASDLTDGWTSCHKIIQGEVSNLIYYLTKNTYIMYMENAEGKKMWRQWVYIPIFSTNGNETINNIAIFSRQFPNTKKYGSIARIKFMHYILGVIEHESLGLEYIQDKIDFHRYTTANGDCWPYPDIKNPHPESVICYPKGSKDFIMNSSLIKIDMYLALNKVHCLYCNKELDTIGKLFSRGGCKCQNIQPKKCLVCGKAELEPMSANSYNIVFHQKCYLKIYDICTSCQQAVKKDKIKIVEEETATEVREWKLCDICYKKLVKECSLCKKLVVMYSGRKTEMCELCSSLYQVECFQCGTLTKKEDAYMSSGNHIYCKPCLHSGVFREDIRIIKYTDFLNLGISRRLKEFKDLFNERIISSGIKICR